MATQRIAFVTDNGKTISAHFGRARYYQVLTIEDGKITQEEQREKLGHRQFAHEHDHEHDHDHEHHHHGNGHGDGHGGGHGMGRHARDKHVRMVEAITDCEALIARGMGRGAHLHLQEAGITPFITDIADIHAAAEAYLSGELKDLTDRLH